MFYFRFFSAIIDANEGKLKEKPLFGLDTSSFIKLKALKVLPADTNSPNIMRLYFPRNKNVEKAIKIDVKSAATDKASAPATTSSANQFSEQELKKDFIEVDDILVVRDPKNIDTLLKSEQTVEVTSVSPESDTLQPTENGESKPEKKNFDTLLNQSVRFKKFVDAFKAKKSAKSGSLPKSAPLPERELFKREGNLNDKMKIIPNTSSPSKVDGTVTQIVEQSIQTATESSDKEAVTENTEQTINAVQDQPSATNCDVNAENEDGGLLGVSLAVLRDDQKIIENDKKRVEQEKKQLQIDEDKLTDAKSKVDFDKTMLDLDQMQLKDDKNQFLVDLEITDSTDSKTDSPKSESKNATIDVKNYSFFQKKILNFLFLQIYFCTFQILNDNALGEASPQKSQVESKTVSEVVEPTPDASTPTVEQAKHDETTPSPIMNANSNDDGLVGMALPAAEIPSDNTTPAATEEANSDKTIGESTVQIDEPVSAALETLEDDSQTLAEKVRGHSLAIGKFDEAIQLNSSHFVFFQVMTEGEVANVENAEMVGATLAQSTTNKPDDIPVNSEVSKDVAAAESTTPNESISDTQSGQTIDDSQVSSTKQVF